ncbi:MAG: hypothetical protein JNL26_11910 [Gemmatimonadetes bacterium]|nr:hypothetical protein [Gemmatimonadota bacterium]
MDRAYRLLQEGADVNHEAFTRVFEVVQARLPALVAKTAVAVDNNIEALYGLVEMGILLGRLPQTEPAQLAQLGNDLRVVLAETIEWSCRFEADEHGGWKAPEEYAALATYLEHGRAKQGKQPWAILTFNYDVGLEHALLLGGFRVDYGFTAMDPTVRSGAIAVHKLHGSLNWAMTEVGELRALDLRTFTLERRSRSRGSAVWPLSREVLAMNRGQPTDRLAIAPPSWNKTRYHEAFATIWRGAANDLAEAETITVIGYSAPQTDGFFRDLLAIGLASPARLRRFTVVDPSPEVGERFSSMLGPLVKSRYEYRRQTFKEFLPELRNIVAAEAA